MAGRPAKPSATKKAEGTYRKDRDRELSVSIEVPEPPEGLSLEESTLFRELAIGLAAQGTIAAVDGLVLSILCSAIAEFRAADKEIKEGGMTFLTENAYEVIRPVVSIRSKASKQIVEICKQFGMTPSARAAILKKAHEPEEDAIEADRRKAENDV